MAIIRKDLLREYTEQLKMKYHHLEGLVIGKPPSENKAHEYNREIDQFHDEYTDIDQTKINIAIDEFRSFLTHLKKLKSLSKNR